MGFFDFMKKKATSPENIVTQVNQLFERDERDYSRKIIDLVIFRNLLFYCIAEGTKIPLLDGTEVLIEDLVDKPNTWLYGFSMDKLKIVPSMMDRCWQTGEKECFEIFLDNGNSFVCTKDHKILTWFGYVEAKDLKKDTPLVPWKNKFYKATGPGSVDGYNHTFQPYDTEWIQTHRMVYGELYGVYDKNCIIHHQNEIKCDNRPENLRLMSKGDHSMLTLIRHKDKIQTGLLRYCATELSTERKRATAKRQWAEDREGMMKSLSNRDKNAFSEFMKAYWADPKRSGTLREKRKIQDRTNAIVAVKSYWNDPVKREEQLRKMREGWEKKKAVINSRVVSVTSVGIRKVYDMSVPTTHNFALSAGVFVHNCGEQWIEVAPFGGTFRRRQFEPYTPTPVSNEIREFVRTVRAMLMSQKLVPKIFPNTNELEDKSAATLGEQLLVFMDAENDGVFIDEKEKVVDWTIIAGTAFMRCYPQMDSGRWFTTKDGILKEGTVCAEAVIPFNVVLDPMGDSLQKKRWVGIKSLKAKEWVEDTFKVKIKGSIGNVQTVDYERRLMKIVSQVSPWKGAGIEMSLMAQDEEDCVLFREVEFKPTDKYPNGRYVIVCNNQMVSDMDRMIVKSEPGTWFYSLTDFHYNRVSGRFWSDSGINDLISPQITINEIDQMLAMNRKSLGRNRISLPTGTVIKRINEGGTGFLAMEYDPRTTGGQAPAIMQGVPLTPQIVEERAINKSQFQDSAGDPKNVLKGQAPSAQSSGVQVDILRETAERSHYPDVDRFNRSLNRVYKKRIILAQEVMTEPRMIKIVGKGNKVEIKQFLGSDLRGNTDIRLELDNGLSTTNSGRLQILMDMAAKGYLGDLTQDPELRMEFLRRAGLSGFSEQVNADMARAEKENACIAMGDFKGIFLLDDEPQQPEQPQGPYEQQMGQEQSPQPPQGPPEPTVLQEDPIFKYDNHPLHRETHRRFIISAEFRDLPQESQMVAIHHTLAHEKAQQIEEEGKSKRPNMNENISGDRLMPLLLPKEQVQYLAQMGIQAAPERITNPELTPKIIPSQQDKEAEKEHELALSKEKEKQKFVIGRAEAEHQAVLTEDQERVKTERALALQNAKEFRENKMGKPIPNIKE